MAIKLNEARGTAACPANGAPPGRKSKFLGESDMERAFRAFLRTADPEEKGFLAWVLDYWAREYPKADRAEEFTIGTAFKLAEARYDAGVRA